MEQHILRQKLQAVEKDILEAEKSLELEKYTVAYHLIEFYEPLIEDRWLKNSGISEKLDKQLLLNKTYKIFRYGDECSREGAKIQTKHKK